MAMLIVASSSAILSFDGLQKVALASRVPEHLAFLFPIAVDTTILMGSLAVLLYELVGVRSVFGWFTVLFGTVLSVTGNVISVSDAGIIAQVLHGIIPVLLCISLESLLRILRFNIQRSNKALAEYEKGTQNSVPPEEKEVEKSEESPVAAEAPSPAMEIQKPVVVETEKETQPPVPVPHPTPSLPSYIAPLKPSEPKAEELSTEELTISDTTSSEDPQNPKEPFTIQGPVILAETLAKPASEPTDTPKPVEPAASTTPDVPAPVVEEPATPSVISDKIDLVEENPEPKKPVRKAPAKRAAPRKATAKPATSTTAAKRSAPRKAVAKATDTAPAPAKEPVKADPPLVPENVEKYKIFLEGVPSDLDWNQKAREIKKVFPDATKTDVKAAFRG